MRGEPNTAVASTERAGGRITSLDGLRALSIGMVVAGHAAVRRGPAAFGWWLALLGRPELGVDVFFVLSGYLITRLLLDEERRSGGISLREFYLRRAFRILPALHFYVLVMAILCGAHLVGISAGSFIDALVFTRNYGVFGGGGWWFGHFWSLAVEEQFYLAWPPLWRLQAAGVRARLPWR